ncbi:MAG: hypothetical protein NT069_05165 [Planctomycetota bacterium]|nr:hypothetical protein [Planctomycetota bacterium]
MDEIPDKWREVKTSALDEIADRSWSMSTVWCVLVVGLILISQSWSARGGVLGLAFGMRISVLGVGISLVLGMTAVWLCGLLFKTDFGPVRSAVIRMLAFVAFAHGMVVTALLLQARYPDSVWPMIGLLTTPLIGFWILARMFELEALECITFILVRSAVDGLVAWGIGALASSIRQ